jgi:hypothetical protein
MLTCYSIQQEVPAPDIEGREPWIRHRPKVVRPGGFVDCTVPNLHERCANLAGRIHARGRLP